nr:P protein [Drosophila kikkawai]
MKILNETSSVINSHRLNSRILRLRAWTDWFEEQHQHNGRFWLVIHIVKLCVLLAVWVYFTFVLVSNNTETKITKTLVTAMPNEIVLRKVTLAQDYLKITLRGPIDAYLTEHPQGGETFGAGVRVEYRNSNLNEIYQHTALWNIVLDSTAKNGEATKFFEIAPPDAEDTQAVVSVESKSATPVSLLIEVEARPMSNRAVIYAGLLIILLFSVLTANILDRTFVALLVGAIGIAVLTVLCDRPDLTTIVSFVNFETLMLLFGLMVIVDRMATTGIFNYLVVLIYRVSMGQAWPLVFFLSMLTAFLSAFLNSHNMALVLTPITIRLCETMALQTQLVLIIMAIYANLGGALTPLGTAANAIVSNHPVAVANGVNFVNFFGHMLPGVLVAVLVAFPLLYLTLRKRLFRLDQNQIDRMDLMAEGMKPPTESLLQLIAQRELRQPSKWWLKPGDNYNHTLARLEDSYRIRDKPLLIKCCITLAFIYLCMILHSFRGVADGGTLGWVILLAAFLLIILDNKSHLDGTLEIIQWTILLFIAALYVLTETVARLGLFKWLGDHAAKALSEEELRNQSRVAIMVLIWTTACLSILIDNIAVTNIMLSFCFEVTDSNQLPVRPMIWAIIFGGCFGGNGSLLAAMSNQTLAWIAQKAGYKIHFCRFFVIGFPIMIVTLVIGSGYLLIDQTLTRAPNPLSPNVNKIYDFRAE